VTRDPASDRRVGVGALVVPEAPRRPATRAEGEVAERAVGADALVAVVGPRAVHEHGDGERAGVRPRRGERGAERRLGA
jgi:hypothetical protein